MSHKVNQSNVRDTVQNMDCLICWTISDTLIDHMIIHLSLFGLSIFDPMHGYLLDSIRYI